MKKGAFALYAAAAAAPGYFYAACSCRCDGRFA